MKFYFAKFAVIEGHAIDPVVVKAEGPEAARILAAVERGDIARVTLCEELKPGAVLFYRRPGGPVARAKVEQVSLTSAVTVTRVDGRRETIRVNQIISL